MADVPPTDPQARKAAIREQARKNRVAQKDKDELSRRICAAFTALPAYQNARTVMWYVDAGSEVRTRHTLPEALTHGKRVVVPWCVVETNELELFHLEDMSELVEGAYKILEPRAELRLLPAKRVQLRLGKLLVESRAFGLVVGQPLSRVQHRRYQKNNSVKNHKGEKPGEKLLRPKMQERGYRIRGPRV